MEKVTFTPAEIAEIEAIKKRKPEGGCQLDIDLAKKLARCAAFALAAGNALVDFSLSAD